MSICNGTPPTKTTPAPQSPPSMGNSYTNGKATMYPNAVPFVGLSSGALHGLRYAFNDQLEGFGVSKSKLVDMCEILSEQMAASENLDLEAKRLRRATKSYFKLLDTDQNKLIDAIGCLSGLAMVSSMRKIEKLIFILELFDFAQLNKLTSDECAMAMITGCGAVAVITSTSPPLSEVVESIAHRCFEQEGLDPRPSTDMDVIPILSMATHIMANSDALAYVCHFDNVLGSQSVTREDEISSVKVGPKAEAEKQLTWFDADVEDAKRAATAKKQGRRDDTVDSDSEDEREGGIDTTPARIKAVHAEGLKAVMAQIQHQCKKRDFRTNKKTRTWRSIVDDGSLTPSAHKARLEAVRLALKQKEEKAGGFDAEQEDAVKMTAAQQTLHLPENPQ